MNETEANGLHNLSTMLEDLAHAFEASLTPSQRDYLVSRGCFDSMKEEDTKVIVGELSFQNETPRDSDCTELIDPNSPPEETTQEERQASTPVLNVSTMDVGNGSPEVNVVDDASPHSSPARTAIKRANSTQTAVLSSIPLFFSQEQVVVPPLSSDTVSEEKKNRMSLPSDLLLKPISPDKLEILTSPPRETVLKAPIVMSIVAPESKNPEEPCAAANITPVQSPFKEETAESHPVVPFSTPTTENVSIIQTHTDSSLPPSPSISQLPSANISHRSVGEGAVDVNSLSARSRQRYFKNLRILNDDSFLTDDSSESVAHVEYFCNGDEPNQNDLTYVPDDDYYKQVVENQPLTAVPEDSKEANTTWNPQQAADPGFSVMDEGSSDIDLVNANEQTDAIPKVDDSIIM